MAVVCFFGEHRPDDPRRFICHRNSCETDNQAWEKAIKECTPRSLSSDEMREVFGVPGRRKLNRTGLQVCHVDYQSDFLMEQFVNSNAEYFEFLRWDGDIGTISARCDDGPSYTVPAKDEQWIGKNDIDLREWLQEQHDEDPDELRARRNFINNATRESVRLKQLKGLISLPKTPAELRKRSCHMPTERPCCIQGEEWSA